MDSKNSTIFNETYTVAPEERITSPEITYTKGEYTVKVTVNDLIAETHKTKVEIGWGGVYINVYNLTSETPVVIGDVVA